MGAEQCREVPDDPQTGADGGPVGFGCVLDAVPINAHSDGTIVVLWMTGEIDLLTQAEVQTALRSGLRAEPRYLLVDLSGVVFCGVRGFSTFADTAHAAADHRVGYALSGLPPHLSRVAATLWCPDQPPRHRSVAAAVTAIRADHAQPA